MFTCLCSYNRKDIMTRVVFIFSALLFSACGDDNTPAETTDAGTCPRPCLDAIKNGTVAPTSCKTTCPDRFP